MAIELATAYVSVVPSFQGGTAALTRGLDGPLDEEGRKAGRRFGSGFSASLAPALKGAAAALGAAFAVDFAGDAIGAASNLEESISKNKVVFGEASEAVLEFADNAAKSLGQSQVQALEATGVFGNLLRSVGLSGEASAEFATDLTSLASDLASFNNVDVDEALIALRSGLVGETEPLKRFGVNLNEATLKAKAFELGLGDGKSVLDANAKAQAAYALIMEQTSLAQGDFARTSDGLANQQKILSAQFEDAKASLGNALLPIMTTAVNFVNDTVIPGFKALAQVFDDEGLGGVISRLGAKFREALPVIGSALADMGAALIEWVQVQAPIFGQKLLELGRQLVAWVGPQIPPLLAELARLLGEVGGWIIRDGVPLLVEKAAALGKALVDWVVTDAIPGLLRALPGIIREVGEWIVTEGVPAFIEFGKDLGSALVEGAKDSLLGLLGDPNLPDNPVMREALGLPPGRELGGPVRAGRPYIVGEKRPELFVPSTSGYILPEVPTGNGGVVNNVTLNYPVPESEEDGVLRALRRVAAEAA